jgi:hypothetical protein
MVSIPAEQAATPGWIWLGAAALFALFTALAETLAGIGPLLPTGCLMPG